MSLQLPAAVTSVNARTYRLRNSHCGLVSTLKQPANLATLALPCVADVECACGPYEEVVDGCSDVVATQQAADVVPLVGHWLRLSRWLHLLAGLGKL